ncbi:MAG: signal peptidase II [Propionibacteriaceae bacterium]|nr:signal peptidase II [Propionibacteriaceae bacterium]
MAKEPAQDQSILAAVRARPVLGWGQHIWLICFALAGFGVDLLTKTLVLKFLKPGQVHEFLGGWFQVQLLLNPGAAFSMGVGITVVFAAFALLALILLATLIGPRADGRFANIVVGLLIAGVAGNLTDRLVRAPGPFRGYVVDFLGIKYFAVFNVADICITAAAVLIILWLLRSSRRVAE